MHFTQRSQTFLHRTFAIAAVFTILEVFASTSAAETVTVTGIDGLKNTGELKSWSSGKLIVEAGTAQAINLSDVRSIAFEYPLQKMAGSTSAVWLSNGDRISAKPVSAIDDVLTVSWRVTGAADSLKIPLEKVVAMIFELPVAMSERLRLFADLDTLPPGSDLVMLSNGDRSQGEFERVGASFVELKVGKTSLKLDRSRVRALRLNPELTNATRASGRRALLTLTDGSRLTVTSIELAEELVKLKSPVLGSLVLPISALASCQFFGERIIPITDYEAAKVEFTPFLSITWPLVQNANVLHGPLRLRGTAFATGLGVHSRMSVTYDLRGDERAFQSIVGIDDSANGRGSAVFAVELDGRRVWTSPEITGKSPPTSVPEIDVRGGKRLTLLVDYGQFADVSDYADWCDAVVILDRAR